MTKESLSKESTGEKLARFGRNINILGATAIGGAALLIPGPNVVLTSWALLNAAQAGGFELWRKGLKKRSKAKQ